MRSPERVKLTHQSEANGCYEEELNWVYLENLFHEALKNFV